MGEKRAFLEKWFAELWGQRRAAIIDEMIDPDCKIHGLPELGPKGPEAFKPFFNLFGAAFKTIHVRIEHSIEEGDWIAFRASVKAMPHEGTEVAFTGGGMAKFNAAGKMVETWNQWDFLMMLAGLEQVPANAMPVALTRLAR